MDFMGEKPGYNPYTKKWTWSDSPWFSCEHDTSEEVVDSISKYAKYSTDWNWIFKIVEKIEEHRFDVEMRQSVVTIFDKDNNEDILEVVLDSKLEAVFEACVEFIEWFNKQ